MCDIVGMKMTKEEAERWMIRQVLAYKNNALDAYRKRILEELPNWDKVLIMTPEQLEKWASAA